jgi:chitinase
MLNRIWAAPRFPLLRLSLKTGRTFAAALLVLACANQTVSRRAPAQQTPPSETWSMGFWTGVTRQPLNDLDWEALTHIMHVAAAPKTDGSLTYSCSTGDCSLSELGAEATNLINTAHAHNVKVILNLGNVPGKLYHGALTTDFNAFVGNIMNLVNAYHYDGVDVDWEQSLDKKLITSLLAALRQELGDRILTVDVDGSQPAFWGMTHQYVDRVNAMTYDMTTPDFSWFNSALYSDSCNCVWSFDMMRRRMIAAGVPAAKLNLGIPFYGWVSNGGGIVGPRLNGPAKSMNQMNYSEMAARYDISKANWDAVAHAPWMSLSSGWLTFDNEQSIAEKVNYVQKNGLGGWIIWEIEQDYLPGEKIKHPLLTAIKNAKANDTTH